MLNKIIGVSVIVALVVFAIFYTKKSTASAPPTLKTEMWTDNIMGWIDNLTQDSRENELLYRPLIDAAEREYNLLPGILGRLLYQESRFRTDIITGATKSSAGAIGIAQFMPATAKEVGINPLDPVQSIRGAAKYLKQLHRRYDSWRLALMAYNWGLGNVDAYIKTGKGAKGQSVPGETVAYASQISTDIGLA